MKIGIIVYSKTGNTKIVADRLKEKLEAAGHEVSLEPVIPEEGSEPGKTIRFSSAPDVSPYEGIVFASPVQGFALAPFMKAYLGQIGPLKGKKTACFVTKHLKGAWTGARSALRFMKKSVESKGGILEAADFIVWPDSEREARIHEILERLSGVFS